MHKTLGQKSRSVSHREGLMTNDKTACTSADMYGTSHHLDQELLWSSTDPDCVFPFPSQRDFRSKCKNLSVLGYEQETYSNTSREGEESQGAQRKGGTPFSQNHSTGSIWLDASDTAVGATSVRSRQRTPMQSTSTFPRIVLWMRPPLLLPE